MSQAEDILKNVFGHTQFKPKQDEIITSVLQNRDVLAILPTGGGKSLCYQIPALCQEGICIVVSPLIALINDQVEQLKRRNVRAVGITSGISRQDLDNVLDNCIYGNYKFLYLSPERLEQPLVQERISRMKVNLLAIDEAHCISEWGHDFRPAYLKINEVFSFIKKAPVIAVTATATSKVQEDIIENLNFKEPVVYTTSFERPQLRYDLEHTTDKRTALIEFYSKSQGTSIAYVRSRKNTAEFSQLLSYNNISSGAYHGGLDPKKRKDQVEKLLANRTRVMVATNAFGMGIDKPDVRSVVHLQLPDSIESYYQETGRAGRDGKLGIAKFIYNENDVTHARNQFIRALPTVDVLKKTYRHLSNYLRIAYGEGQEHPYQLPFADFCRTYDLNGIVTYNALTALDRFGVISLDQSYGNRSVVRFRESGTKIMDFTNHDQVAHAVVQAILRSYGSSREQNLQINSKLIAVRSNTTEKQVTEVLKQLHKRELIYARITGTDLTLHYLQPREDHRTVNRFARELERYNEIKIQKLEAMIALLDQKQCVERGILSYFGEHLKEDCGRCSYCRKKHPIDIKRSIELLVSQGEISLDDIIHQIAAPKTEILTALRQLTDDGLIINIAGKAFRINER